VIDQRVTKNLPTRSSPRRKASGQSRSDPSCGACPTSRRTKAQIGTIKQAIKGILKADHPMTVRQVFYQLVTHDEIEKSEQEYQGTVIRLLTTMRLANEIPFEWIIDETRSPHETQTFDSISDAARDTARFYRRSALRECADYIEIWSEKEALAGLIWDVASEYDVPVVVTKGMPSLTQIYASAVNVNRAAEAGKLSYIYQFGDHDPSGVLISETIKRRLEELCERFSCPSPSVERVALIPAQIAKFRLPTRPTKRHGNSHALAFAGRSTELDAMPADALRKLVSQCIERHIDPDALKILRTAEDSERELLSNWADRIARQSRRNGLRP
jgi:hypothetical protein